MEIWNAITADRTAFAAYLAKLDDDQWTTPTWCAGWSVKHVVAHLLGTSTQSKGQIFRRFAAAGFNLDRYSAKYVAETTARWSNAELASQMGDTAGVRRAPPGLKPVGLLSEVLIHAHDIAIPLDVPFAVPSEHLVAALDHMKHVQPVLGAKKRIAGLRLQASDIDWSHGDGPLVEGSGQMLLAAMTGRRPALHSLSGAGVEQLRSR